MENINKISINDENYPEALRDIKSPPETLYYKGILPSSDSVCFAVVGTRKCSSYGKQVAMEFSSDLAEAGLVIVSGLAPGIDTVAHQAAVERSRPTIAVLGTGLDEKSVYPQTNLKLAKKILESKGCLISEYPPGTQGAKFTFPKRNRIISGLSRGVLVVEAKEKSGSLITANYALEQNKKLFAVPGQIHSLNSKGCHWLIKQGARLVDSADDILKDLNLQKAKNLALWPETRGISGFAEAENEEESLVLDAISQEALEMDKIIKKTNLPASKVAGSLAILEIKGKVRNLGGNVYALTR